jgi:hypothetical protein
VPDAAPICRCSAGPPGRDRRRPVEHGYVNPFTDPGVLAACELLLRTVVTRFKDHPAIALWNLGNEPDLFAWPPSSAVGRSWVRRMTAVIHEIDLRHPVTCGLHTANLVEDNGLRVHEVFAETDLAVMHGYPMGAEWAAGPLDPNFVPFSCALTCAVRQADHSWRSSAAAPPPPRRPLLRLEMVQPRTSPTAVHGLGARAGRLRRTGPALLVSVGAGMRCGGASPTTPRSCMICHPRSVLA